MKGPKLAWIIAGVLFAAASIAIHYEVKIGMRTRSGGVHALGHLRVSELGRDFMLRDQTGVTQE